jgi:ubiquinone/menaquinone biosynthesis C-methylase UbiE
MGSTKKSLFGGIIWALHPEGIPAGAAKVYNKISGTSIFLRHYDLIAEDVVKFCSNGKLLDIGTGPARLLIPLHRQAPGLQLTGTDISQAMVIEAKRNIAAAGLSDTINTCQAGAKQLPFENNYFDIVISTGSLHHWKEPLECMAEIHRVLKPGGIAMMYDLVKNTPKDVLAEGRKKYGRYRMFLLWLHSFEEPFYNPESMMELADPKLFQNIHTRWTGLLCRLTLRKPAGL